MAMLKRPDILWIANFPKQSENTNIQNSVELCWYHNFFIAWMDCNLLNQPQQKLIVSNQIKKLKTNIADGIDYMLTEPIRTKKKFIEEQMKK